MLSVTLAVSLLLPVQINPVQSAIEHVQSVASYQMIVKSISRDKTEIMHYYFKTPGYVRLEFVKPFNGAVLVFDPTTKQAKVWPFGYRRFPAFTLSPENRLILGATDRHVDQSDVGVLFRNVKVLQEHGKTQIVGTESVGGKEGLHITVEGNPGFSVETVHLSHLWLDQTTGFPLRVSNYDEAGEMIEVVEIGDLRINPVFPGDFFNQ